MDRFTLLTRAKNQQSIYRRYSIPETFSLLPIDSLSYSTQYIEDSVKIAGTIWNMNETISSSLGSNDVALFCAGCIMNSFHALHNRIPQGSHSLSKLTGLTLERLCKLNSSLPHASSSPKESLAAYANISSCLAQSISVLAEQKETAIHSLRAQGFYVPAAEYV